VLPALLLLALLLHLALKRALLDPLQRVVMRMRQEVMAHRPAHDREDRFLTPGLRLLHKYFMYLTHLSKQDPLTGLSNRAIFEERLRQAILEGKRSGRKYALVFIDIDHFRRVNQELGPYFGDGLLKQLGRRLTEMLRESDSVARLEKDNFAILLGFDEDDRLSALVEKIYQTLCQPYRVYGREVEISVSIGVAVYPNDAQDMDELAIKAGQALMQAQKGDWPVVFLERDGSGLSAFSVIQSLRQALDDEEFELVYQPVMSLQGHRTGYFEALLRWKHPEQHHYSIEHTIELAEKNHLIKPLTHWILNRAVARLAEYDEPELRIAINLSMVDLHEEDLPDRVRETLERYQVSSRRLLIEITEGQIMQEPEQVLDILGRLARMGISLSIDDFGTGQASLTYLKKMPVEKLKIDQSFVRHLDEDADDCHIVEATIQLAHTLGMDVVAEGVESAEVHNLLLEMGCDFVQGYYISRPLDAEHMLEWFHNTRPGA
jgi:diguanylate cyclase (GGDEF)-like protein